MKYRKKERKMLRDKKELRKKIDEIIEREYKFAPLSSTTRILSLIEGQRCEWASWNGWNTGCGKSFPYPYNRDSKPFCPGCGKKIEVKDA
jgi:hypothetical protein